MTTTMEPVASTAQREITFLQAVNETLHQEMERDPLDIIRAVLAERAVLSSEGAERVVEEVKREIEEALRFAEASPYPDPSELMTDVYS